MLTEQDCEDLRTAVRVLEYPSFLVKVVNIIGMPLERILASLPGGAATAITKATTLALDKAMDAAIWTIRDPSTRRASTRLHKFMVAATGAIGGAFGLPAIAVELPITTAIMLRSIADVARAEGEDIHDPDCAVACMQVLALGGPASGDDASETSYFTIRSAMAVEVHAATHYLSAGGLAGSSTAPVLARLMSAICARFNIVVTEKAAAQAVPVLGAAGGALINSLFIDHFQDMARGQFVVRRLERTYGEDAVREFYNDMAARMKNGGI